ncbi:MAG: hypothetical protein COB49_05210, partial [Alphaproteobacteria bacterium]
IAKFTPGFSYDDEFGRTASDRPVIRGQATILGASGVSTFVDGVLIGGTLLDYDINDVERIEVIKGPQSALYGRNTYSGAINIITKSPTDELSGSVKVEAAEFDQYEISGSIRGPITDTLSGSLTARYYERGGTFTNIFDNSEVGQQESESISGVLYFQPNEKLDIRARVRYSRLHDDQLRLFSTAPADNNCFGPDIGGVYLGNFRYFCGEIVEQDINIDDVRLLDEKGFDDSDTWETSVSVDYEVSEQVTLTWINGYNKSSSESKFDFAANPGSLSPFAVNFGVFPAGPPPVTGTVFLIAGPVADFASVGVVDSWDYSTEFRVAYEGERFSALLGGYYFDSNSDSVGTREAPLAAAAIIEESFNAQVARQEAFCGTSCAFALQVAGESLDELVMTADRTRRVGERDNIAAFGLLEGDVTEKLTVTAEVRFARERVTSTTFTEEAIYDYLGTFIGLDHDRDGVPDALVNTGVRKSTFNSTTPRFTVKFAAADNINLYGVAARGTKPGGFNNIELETIDLDTFEEESVWSFEAGAKTSFLNGRFVFNLALYHNTINGYQLTQSIVIPSLNETTTAINNAGKVRVKGVEAEVVIAPEAIPGLIITANYALADSSFLEGTDINEGKLIDVQDDGRVNCSTGTVDGLPCQTTGDNVTPGSIVGRALPRAPKHMFNIAANYTRAISDDWSLVLNASLSHESKKFVQVHNLAFTGSATLVNASIGVENDNIRLVAWVKNLTDEDSAVAAIRFAEPTESFQRNFLGTPRVGRQFGFTGTYKF